MNSIHILRKEENAFDAQIQNLSEKRDVIRQARRLLEKSDGRVLTMRGPGRPVGSGKKAKKVKKTRSPRKAGQSTMEMARQVLRNSGGSLSVGEIHNKIHETFGVNPASSLNQMLYKRARSGTGFFRTKDGKYGVPAESKKAA